MRPTSPRSSAAVAADAAPAQTGGARGTDRSARSATAAEPQRAPPASNCICSRGNTESRNENVSRSMIRKSRNVSVSCRMSNLKRDSAIRITMSASDSAAQCRAAATPPAGSSSRRPRQQRQRDRERAVFGGEQNRAAPPDARRTIRPAQRKESGAARLRAAGLRSFRGPATC